MSKPTIAELEAILQNEGDVPIEILPNGEVRTKGATSAQETGGRKPLKGRQYKCVACGAIQDVLLTDEPTL